MVLPSAPPVCPDGEAVHSCRFNLCMHKGTDNCLADPSAVCRVNPCGGCKREFYNSKNELVQCTPKGTDYICMCSGESAACMENS